MFCTTFASSQSPTWTGSWAAAPLAAPDVKVSDEGVTFRNIIHLSLGGKAVRIRLSNEYCTKPLRIEEVHMASAADKGSIVAGSDRPVLFGAARSILIPAGTVAISDPVSMVVPSFANLAVSIHLSANAGSALTYHAGATVTNFMAEGNQTAETLLRNPVKTSDWYLLTGVDVDAGPKASSVVVLGASIANGAHSTDDKNLRWPDDLARRLQASPSTANIGVLNEASVETAFCMTTQDSVALLA